MESIVYAVDWNQIRENAFSGAAWLDGSGGGGAEVIEQLRKPTALICSAKGAERNPLAGGRKKRDDLLLDMIRSAIDKGGTVLIPTDSSARVLELSYILEHAWQKASLDRGTDNPLKAAKLYLASKNVGATMRYARSMVEWMDENVVRDFEAESMNASNSKHKRTESKQIHARDSDPASKSSSPFEFKHMRFLERNKQIEKITSTKAARVILASDSSLEWGFSKDILKRIAADPANLIILTEDYGAGRNSERLSDGLGLTLWNWYQEKRDGVAMETSADGHNLEQVHTGGRELKFRDAERVTLEGHELLIYQQYLATKRRLQNTLQSTNGTNPEATADALDEASSTSSSSSEESDPEKQGKALNAFTTVAHLNRNKAGLIKETLGVNILLRQPGVYDYDVRGKKGREQMFPYVNKRRRADDFGDLIRPEDYLRAEERDEASPEQENGTGKQTKLGQKRKWEDSGLQPESTRRGLEGSNKRRQQGLNSGVNPQANGINGDAGKDGHDGDQDEISDEESTELEEPAIGPSKVILKSTSVQTHLKVAYIDFTGLHDQRSLSMLIPLIQPRKLILIGGNASETAYLANDYIQKLKPSKDSDGKAQDNVFTPLNGERIEASVDTNAWTVKLSEALVKRLHWQNVRGLGVVTLMGHLISTTTITETDNQPTPSPPSKKRQKLLKRDADEASLDPTPTEHDPAPPPPTPPPPPAPPLIPTLDILPATLQSATRSVAQPLHVGDLKLADLRRVLQAAGHSAEFRGEGTLLIDGLVAVRKSAAGLVEVEGGGLEMGIAEARAGEAAFYAVKRRLYEGLAVVAGG